MIENILYSSLWLLFYYLLFYFLRGFYRHCIRRPKNLEVRYSNPNVPVWACVTGATSGIGLVFARELASRGFNILLVSRSEKKLKDVQDQLKSEFKGVNFAYRVADFGSDQSVQFYQQLAQDISKYDIGLLINNAGVMYPGGFLEVSPELTMQTMEVNIFPLALLTRFMLPIMRNRKARSGIINVSSLVSQHNAMPNNAVYGGTKSFDDHFSRCLALDNEDKIDILCLCPGPVQTPLLGGTKNPITISAQSCVRAGLSSLGYQTLSLGHFFHGMVNLSITMEGEWLSTIIWGIAMKGLGEEFKKVN